MNKKMNNKTYKERFETKKKASEKMEGFPPEILDALEVLYKENDIRKLLDSKFNKSKDKEEKEEEKEEKKEDKKEKEEEKRRCLK
jgi:hypothetical protein